MNVRSAPRNAACPRCGARFHCGVDDAAPCACGTIALAPGMLAALARRYQGCLCPDCLRAAGSGNETGFAPRQARSSR